MIRTVRQGMHSHAVAVLAAVAAVVVLGISQPASAGFITEASKVLREPPTAPGGFTFKLTIDQSGLTMGYVSGVTDFATYVALSPAHFASNIATNYAASFIAPPNAIVDYDLGLDDSDSPLRILQLAFWQYPHPTTGSILDFDVYTSNGSTFADSLLVGSFTAVIDGSGLGAPGTGVQVFDLLDSSAQFLRIDVQTVAGGGGFGWSEVAFDVIPELPELPEPSTAALLGLGLAALAARRRSLGGAR